MSRLPLHFALTVVCMLAFPGQLFAASSGITVGLRASESSDAPVTETVELYSSSHALVIGIDNYSNGWPKLTNAVKDAELISVELEAMGFEVELHKNVSASELATIFKRFFILKGTDPEARLLIWFAGHGATIDEEGYLVPADAPVPGGRGGAEFKFASVALRDFGTFMRQAVAKHVYAVFDSCFAGTVFSSQRAMPPAAITRATTLPVRQFLTSGDAEQTVSDDGTFRELFIRAIKGDERADANDDGYVTASELGMFLGDRVTNLTQSKQTPRYGKLRDKNFDRGDFVFALPEGLGGAAVASKTQAEPPAPADFNGAEVAFWNSIKDSGSADQYDAYLSQYPAGTFAALAMVRKNELARKAEPVRAAAPAPAPPPVRETFKVALVDQEMVAPKVANVRETPFPTATRVAQLEPGTVVWATGETRTSGGLWYQVARDGVELGFVYGPLLEQVATTARLVPVEPLPFKSAGAALANAGSQVVASAPTPDRRLSLLVEDLLQEVDSAPQPDPAVVVPSQATTTPPASVVIQSAPQPAVAMVSQPSPIASPPVVSDFVQRYLISAAQGNAKAELALGYMYETGEHVAMDKLEAERWYKKAAANGEVDAMISLALMYESGDGMAKDAAQSARWYREAAGAGHADAQQTLANLYETGSGVEKDAAEAARWYEKAARQGRVVAQNNLGRLYQLGVGVPQDPKQAIFWYEQAAAQGSEAARKNLQQLLGAN